MLDIHTPHVGKSRHPSPLEWAKAKFNYANEKTVCDFRFVDNSSVCHICHHLRDIHSRDVHDLDVDLSNGPRSNLTMQMGRPYASFDLLAKATFATSVTIAK